jgi:hypothetical protein
MNRIPRWPIVIGSIVGLACTAVGLRALADHVHDVPPSLVVRWLLGLALAHDLVLVPVVLAVGVALRRWVPVVVRAEVAGALIVSGVVVLEAWPALRGYGRLPNNPSVLPRNYAVGLAVTLACVWAIAALIAAARIVRRR